MKKKRYLVITLFLILALVISGCGKSEKNDADSSKDTITTEAKGSVEGSTDAAAVGKTDHETPMSGPDRSGVTKDSEKIEVIPDAPKESSTASEKAAEAREYSVGADTILSESKMSLTADVAKIDGYYADDGFYDSVAPELEYPGGEIIYDPDISEPTRPQVKAGTLTAGEWNDNRNFDFIKKLMSDGQNYNYKTYFTNWNLSPFSRMVITVNDASGASLQGADIVISDANGTSIWKGVTDQNGTVYAYYSLTAENVPAKVMAKYGDTTVESDVSTANISGTETIVLTLDAQRKSKTLDLMFTVDTTGSMGDEIYYLQSELQDVIKRVQADTANIPLRLSMNFYRDHGDKYVVKPYEFSTDINEQLAYLNTEYADGGGDFEEAVELALESSVNDHLWNEDSIKLLFLVLDAPPHNTEEIRESLIATISKASEMGIRIIPVASSGIDKDTEFILRAFAMTTGGTYTFLTNDSGVGESHIEPTVGEYKVEQLNDLLVRIIEEYIG